MSDARDALAGAVHDGTEFCDHIDPDAVLAALRKRGFDVVPTAMHTVTPKGIVATFRQHDFIPAFAAYLHEPNSDDIPGEAFCLFNLQAFLATFENSEETPEELATSVADSMMHELMHVIEAWAGAEFSEDRVEGLIAKYRQCPDGHRAPTREERRQMMVDGILSMADGEDPDDFTSALAEASARNASERQADPGQGQ